MRKKAPGKAFRKGRLLSDMFSDELSAKAWIVKQRWPDGPNLPSLRR